jgi:hypothetical protein
MSAIKRRSFIQGLGAAISLGPAALSSTASQGAANADLTRIDPKVMMTLNTETNHDQPNTSR